MNKIGFQFHTPFIKDDPLWMPFGYTRSEVVEKIIGLRKKYSDFVINGEKQPTLMKGNWGGVRHYTSSMSIMGYTFTGSYGKDKATLLYRKCRQQRVKTNL